MNRIAHPTLTAAADLIDRYRRLRRDLSDSGIAGQEQPSAELVAAYLEAWRELTELVRPAGRTGPGGSNRAMAGGRAGAARLGRAAGRTGPGRSKLVIAGGLAAVLVVEPDGPTGERGPYVVDLDADASVYDRLGPAPALVPSAN